LKKKDCNFCKIVQGNLESWKIFENENVYAFLDINPVNKYHALVIPKNHYKNIYEIPQKDYLSVMKSVKEITERYKKELNIDNVQIISNSGIEAQQDVFHFHVHIVPRESNDGQDIKWDTKPKLREEFDEMIKNFKNQL